MSLQRSSRVVLAGRYKDCAPTGAVDVAVLSVADRNLFWMSKTSMPLLRSSRVVVAVGYKDAALTELRKTGRNTSLGNGFILAEADNRCRSYGALGLWLPWAIKMPLLRSLRMVT
jgi:hypothetical protein